MEEKDFINYYNKEYKSILDVKFNILLKDLKSKYNTILFLILFFDIIPTLLILLFMKNIIFKFRIIIVIVYNLVSIFLSIFNIKKFNNKITYKFNESIIEDIIKFISNGKEYEYSPDSRISKQSFAKTNIFNLDSTKYNGSNYVKCKYKDNDFVLGDFEVYYNEPVIKTKTITRDNKTYLQTIKSFKKHNIFSGIYIGATLNKTIHHSIYMIPKSIESFIDSKIKNFIEIDGDIIELENIDISDNYNVYTNNEIKSRQILTLPFMEKINELDNFFQEKKYIIFKDDGRLVILIKNSQIEKLKNIKIVINNDKLELDSVLKIFNEINKYFKIYEILDLKKDGNK